MTRRMRRRLAGLAAAAALAAGLGASGPARAADPFIGQITMFGGNFAPRGWAFCNGQLLSIATNTALFSILGTTYGGDGEVTFALPDLRGRVAVHSGGGSAGPGLTPRRLGQRGGTETNTLTVAQLPAHGHPHDLSALLHAGSANGTTAAPSGKFLAATRRDRDYGSGTPDVTLAAGSVEINGTVGLTGGGAPVNNMPPFQAVNFLIALFGIFPSSS